MITSVRIWNYRSFVDAAADLSAFTLVLGANGSGKSGFLKLLQTALGSYESRNVEGRARYLLDSADVLEQGHKQRPGEPVRFELTIDQASSIEFKLEPPGPNSSGRIALQTSPRGGPTPSSRYTIRLLKK
jgi:predicted ATPase